MNVGLTNALRGIMATQNRVQNVATRIAQAGLAEPTTAAAAPLSSIVADAGALSAAKLAFSASVRMAQTTNEMLEETLVLGDYGV
jgi:hypothetical protein